MFKKDDPAQSPPAWVVTYGDCMSLLLCFFVALVSMGEIKKEKFQQAAESLHRAFGGFRGSVGSVSVPTTKGNLLIEKLLALDAVGSSNHARDAKTDEILDKTFRVTKDRDGLRIVIGGPITFDRFSATVDPEARERLAQAAQLLAGSTAKLVIRGHATGGAFPQDAIYSDPRDLSYARAVAVADELEHHGVRRNRMVLVAAGDTEPPVQRAHTEERRAVQRRVEIVVTEDLATEAGDPESTAAWQESPSGR